MSASICDFGFRARAQTAVSKHWGILPKIRKGGNNARVWVKTASSAAPILCLVYSAMWWDGFVEQVHVKYIGFSGFLHVATYLDCPSPPPSSPLYKEGDLSLLNVLKTGRGSGFSHKKGGVGEIGGGCCKKGRVSLIFITLSSVIFLNVCWACLCFVSQEEFTLIESNEQIYDFY